MSKYFYHGMMPKKEPIDKIITMINIIESGGIKSKRKLKINNLYVGYNGSDYISLCNKEDNSMYNFFYDNMNSYEDYIYSNFCFIVSDEINAIKTKKFDIKGKYVSYMQFYSLAQGDIRYSDMFDEWQVKDEINMDKIIGIGLPFNLVFSYKNSDQEFKKYIELLFNLVHKYNLDIVNTEDFNFVEKYEQEKNNSKGYIYHFN